MYPGYRTQGPNTIERDSTNYAPLSVYNFKCTANLGVIRAQLFFCELYRFRVANKLFVHCSNEAHLYLQ